MLVFWRDDGRPLDPDSVSQRFRLLVERTGLPRIRFHDLRHTFATPSLKAGIPTEVVSRILGHKHVATTQAIYQHAVPALEEGAISRFAALLEKAKARSFRYQTGIRGRLRRPNGRGTDRSAPLLTSKFSRCAGWI